MNYPSEAITALGWEGNQLCQHDGQPDSEAVPRMSPRHHALWHRCGVPLELSDLNVEQVDQFERHGDPLDRAGGEL